MGVSVHLGGFFDYDEKCERLDEVVRELEQPDVWNDSVKAQSLGKERVELETIVKTLTDVATGVDELVELLDMALKTLRRRPHGKHSGHTGSR